MRSGCRRRAEKRSKAEYFIHTGTALQIHFLAIAKWIAAFSAAGACRMKMMIVASLEYFATDKAITVRTFDAKQLLIAFLAVRYAVLAHILAVQNSRAILATEATDVPLSV